MRNKIWNYGKLFNYFVKSDTLLLLDINTGVS